MFVQLDETVVSNYFFSSGRYLINAILLDHKSLFDTLGIKLENFPIAIKISSAKKLIFKLKAFEIEAFD